MHSDVLLNTAREVESVASINETFRTMASKEPNATFLNLVREHETLTYREVYEQACQMAKALMDVGDGSRRMVGIYLPTGSTYVVAWFGSLLGDHVDVSINYELTGSMLAYAVNKADLDIVVTDSSEGYQELTDAAKEFRKPVTIVLAGASGKPRSRLTDLHRDVVGLGDIAETPKRAESALPADVDLQELASIRYTSGSTGSPKGVMMCQKHMMASALAFCELTQLRHQEMLYTCFPFHHVLASVTGILSAMATGGSLAIAPKFSASRYWDELRESNASVAHVLDPLVPILMKQPESNNDRKHDVRRMYTTAGEHRAFKERFGVEIVSLYDMSELTVPLCYEPGSPRREGSCGKESGFFDVRIVDEDDREIPVGEDGQIVVRSRSPGVMLLGYYNDAEKTVEEWQNLWFHTGDRGYTDGDGYFYFTGRAGDRIRHQGVNISPGDIEDAATSHSAIREAAAIGVPGALGEDDLKICYTLNPNVQLSESELLQHIQEIVPRYMVPRYAEQLEMFPKTETQKIQKGKLRDIGNHGLTKGTWDEEAGMFLRDVDDPEP